ncbi:hypothetical protein ACM01_22985 [Streptomyces viridochromogenes]|uniref:Uncharacterized protein n=1 Tax=Streptomyces viridochromogenes TaxID=1938 RepID=A0A0J7Z9D3_STRVR|nr:hypothetical protein ACM01_22985 [Streptomyces viridochromogenes]
MSDQQFHQRVESCAVIADPQLGQLGTVPIHQSYVVVSFRPVDAAEDRARCLYLRANVGFHFQAEHAAL